MHLIGPCGKSIRQQQAGGAIIKNNVSLTRMTIFRPTTAWFEILKIPTYELGEVTGVNDEYIDKSSIRVRQFFSNTCLSIYPCPRKVFFDKWI